MPDLRIIDDGRLVAAGDHEQKVIDQANRCLSTEEGSLGFLSGDAHFGYSAPIGLSWATREHVSPAAVGYDIGCIAAGERVLTDDGYHRAIEQLSPSDTPTRPDSEGHLAPVDPYLGLLNRGTRPVSKISLADGRSIRLTPDHEVRTRHGWKRADQLTTGDVVLCPAFVGLPYEESSEDVAFVRWLAYVNGDGHIPGHRSDSGITTSVWEDVPLLLRDLYRLGVSPRVYTRVRPNGSFEASIRVTDRDLVDRLAEAGAPIGRKIGRWTPRLREYVLGLPAWQRAQYLSSFASAEGTTTSYQQGIRSFVIKQMGDVAAETVASIMESLDFSVGVTVDTGGCHVVQLQGGTEEQARFLRTVGYCYATRKRAAAARALDLALQATSERRERARAALRMATLIENGARVRDAALRAADETGLSPAACFHLYYRKSPPRTRRNWVAASDALGECIWVPVRSSEPDSAAAVYDVATGDPNQSFVASGITVHNCGNMAVATALSWSDLRPDVSGIMDRIFAEVPFGMGRRDGKAADHPVIDEIRQADYAPQRELAGMAAKQLGTVGAGNHYVDLFRDEKTDRVWVGVHFGSRGFGHKTATAFLGIAARENGRADYVEGKGEMEAPPDLLHVNGGAGQTYLRAMWLAGKYAYAGREVVVQQVLDILGTTELPGSRVHNHHNFAWEETHLVDGDPEKFYVVRKGATPAFPGQRGFVGATMGEPSVILEGVAHDDGNLMLYSTVHGAGRAMGRKAAAGKQRKRWTCNNRDCDYVQRKGAPAPEQKGRPEGWVCPTCGHVGMRKIWVTESKGAIDWDATLADLSLKGIELRGANAEEAPLAYKRLDEVLAWHEGSVKILHRLIPVGVAMAPGNVADPYKD